VPKIRKLCLNLSILLASFFSGHGVNMTVYIYLLYLFMRWYIIVVQPNASMSIQPMLPYLTLSEIHAVMTSGFATLAGGVLAAYISLGVSMIHRRLKLTNQLKKSMV